MKLVSRRGTHLEPSLSSLFAVEFTFSVLRHPHEGFSGSPRSWFRRHMCRA